MHAELATLVADYLDRKAAKEKIEAELAEISELILKRVAEGEKAELEPGVGIRVQRPNKRFDPLLAQQILTGEQWAAILAAVPSATLAQKVLPGALYEQCTRLAGQASVRAL
jgi:hypothetical protein